MTTYIVLGFCYADGMPVTFGADDAEAAAIDIHRLFQRGRDHVLRSGLLRSIGRSPHAWGIEYARDNLTDYPALARRLPSSSTQRLLQVAVAAWAKTRWPRLQIIGVDERQLRAAMQSMTALASHGPSATAAE